MSICKNGEMMTIKTNQLTNETGFGGVEDVRNTCIFEIKPFFKKLQEIWPPDENHLHHCEK